MNDAIFEEQKAALRTEAHKRRARFHTSLRDEASRAAARHFFDAVGIAPHDIVAGYWPIRDELDCRPILVRLMDAGQPVCLPVMMGPEEPLELRLWRDGEALYEAGYGTLAPADGAPLVEPDVILMPLLGFDRAGTRLGYGGGYYDRTLARLKRRPRLVGLAFAMQELEHIPRADHDVPLDAIVTEAGVRHFQLVDAAS
jgi:5-formyltetrahydrofolate cyclo-ligase